MKRKNLFLSLISSIVVAVVIVTVTIVSVASPKKKNNTVNPGSNINFVDNTKYEEENKNRDGSAEKPYLIYSAESYNDMLSTYGSKNRYFELAEDIDFTGVEYVTLFNATEPMNSTINGNGHSLNNITIHATKDNINKFSFNTYARVAMFGWMENAKVSNLVISNLNVTVDEDVYEYVANFKEGHTYVEVVASSIAYIARNTTFDNVTLNSKVTGFVYTVGEDVENSFGGVVTVAESLTITNSNINTEIDVNGGSGFNIGGIAGYGRIATVKDSNIDVKVALSSENRVYVGGVFSYGRTLDIENVNVNVDIKSKDSQEVRNAFINGIDTDENDLLDNGDGVSSGAGIVVVIRADDETQKSTFKNIKVTSNVDADIIYSGAFLDTWTINPSNTGLITIEDVIVDVNADVIALHGLSRDLGAATIIYSQEAKAQEGYFNIRMAGSVKNGYFFEANSKKYTRNSLTVWIAISAAVKGEDGKWVDAVDYSLKDFYVELSENFYNKITSSSSEFDYRNVTSNFGSVKKVG